MSRKLLLTFKDTEALQEAITLANLDDEYEIVDAQAKKWIEWGEYVKVEIDLDAGTARVVPVEEYKKKK